jgi:hypothetical protein
MDEPVSYIYLSGTGAAVSRPCRFHGYALFPSGDDGQMQAFDDTTGTQPGNSLICSVVAAGTYDTSKSLSIEQGIECSNGIYVQLTGATAVIYYSLL